MVNAETMVNKLMTYYGLNQEEFAVKFDFTPTQVSRWLNGKATPNGDDYMRLWEAYNEIKDQQPPLFTMLA